VHKRLFNEAVIRLTLTPEGPILIKAGEGEADPTRPDMNFVRTAREGRDTVYLPGSSLKGVLRAHSERLARTVETEERRRRGARLLACDPLADNSCGRRLEREGRDWSGARKHRESCFVCRLFGNNGLGSHFRTADAYPDGSPRTEERNGVAIDRIYGSVAVGPFNYETVTGGEFRTALYLRNFTVSQVGLLALTLRDLEAGRVRLGFGKSRGLGVVTCRVDALTLRYPLLDLQDGSLRLPGGEPLDAGSLYGVGRFVPASEGYGYPASDEIPLPQGYHYEPDGWLGAEVQAPAAERGGVEWQALGRACVPHWKAVVEDVS
jgi:CRISPR/Cas system CSM-associated protein Csm3 (group 7 of RAMP superfamily)